MSITVADLKAHLNITFDTDDALLEGKIAASQTWIERFTGTAFGDYEDGVPAPLDEAVRKLAGHLYENREATIADASASGDPFGVFDLIAPYREWVF